MSKELIVQVSEDGPSGSKIAVRSNINQKNCVEISQQQQQKKKKKKEFKLRSVKITKEAR